jgi:hypothetical protein
MQRFFSAIAIIFVSLGILCFGAVIIGRAQPIPEYAEFQRCDDVPCYKGVVLGKTSWQDAESVLLKIPNSIRNRSFGIKVARGQVRAVTAFFPQNDIVQELDISYRQPSLTAAEVVANFGIPCAVYQNNRDSRAPKLVILAYPDRVFWFHTKDWHLSTSSYLRQADLGGPELMKESLSARFRGRCWGAKEPEKYGWKGFRHYPLE